MPRRYFHAVGYMPRVQNEEEARSQLWGWLFSLVARGRLPGTRTPMHPPWEFSDLHRPSGALVHYRLTLWNFMEIPIISRPESLSERRRTHGSTKGYVTCAEVRFERVARGDPEGPFAVQAIPEDHVTWEVIRRLPDNDREAAAWGYRRENRTQWEVILRECRRYNRTLRQRLLEGYSASRAHRSTVQSLERQSVELIYRAAFEMGLAAGSSEAFNPIPWFSETAVRTGYRLHWEPGATLPRLVRE